MTYAEFAAINFAKERVTILHHEANQRRQVKEKPATLGLLSRLSFVKRQASRKVQPSY